jgi:DNA repair photolyase
MPSRSWTNNSPSAPKKGQYGIIVLSSATDPYLKIDQTYQLTRKALEVILKHRFPVHMITKSSGIERDFDLLHQIDQNAILPTDLQSTLKRGTIITYSFSTLDDPTAKIFEPGAPSPSSRLQTLKNTVQEGFLTGISMMPLLPFITDTTESLHNMFATFKETGAHYVLPATLTLFGAGKADSKTLMLNAIQKHYPHLLERYHQYFNHSTQMPQYYAHAFYRKMKELSAEYELPNSILHGPE